MFFSRAMSVVGVLGVLGAMSSTAFGQVQAAPGFQVKHTLPGDGNVGMTLESPGVMTAAYSQFEFFNSNTFESDSSINVRQIALPNGPVGPVISNHPQTIDDDGQSTFVNSFAASDGNYALTGTTGSFSPGNPTPGDLYLTDLLTGTTTSLPLAGNFDATASGGGMYVTAAAGTGAGLSSDGSSGIFAVDQSNGVLNGTSLVLDTGAPSGQVAGNQDGDLFFDLGGNSATLGAFVRSIFRIDSDDAAGGTPLTASDVDLLIDGPSFDNAAAPFFIDELGSTINGPFISDMVIDEQRMFVSLTGFNADFSASAGQVLEFELTDNAGDFSASFVGPRAFNPTGGIGSLAYDASDDLVWMTSGSDLFAVPEPAGVALLGLGGLFLLGRRR